VTFVNAAAQGRPMFEPAGSCFSQCRATMSDMWRACLLSFAFVLVAGTASAQPAACLLASEHPMVVATLFFGRDIHGRPPVSDRDWAGFVARIVAQEFPDGFTVQDGDGEWRDPATRTVVRERSKILTVAATSSPLLAGRLQTVIDAYKRQFRQSSVGVITTPSCAAF
jgi:hypothetical protein